MLMMPLRKISATYAPLFTPKAMTAARTLLTFTVEKIT
jgi:hypothetical protein